ncbi:hypothetical protein CCH79_00009251 [Gambusia affinis]|uniref:Reverse transcriptase domain-containing protein n=1 Tax=Gambusia affinis TaxID=33528 RepID=A0A315W3W5_GAMAF|nr:hypothetical protein CCH79_00009251 [Gambusia affinis]
MEKLQDLGQSELQELLDNPERVESMTQESDEQKMAVSISTDLTVQVLDDPNKVKLTDRQQQLHAAIQKGEPKCLGLSQVMLGLMVMTYSLPLHFAEHTHVVIFGVPWWTGLTVQACLVTSVAAMVLSAVAVIIYSLDLYNHQLPLCKTTEPSSHFSEDPCWDQISTAKFSKGLKSSLLFFTLVQAAISAIFCWLLYRQKNIFAQYAIQLRLNLQLGGVPTLWKTSCIIPVPKKSRPSELNDFRPVALTSHLMKTLERLFLKHLRMQVQDAKDPLQFAYSAEVGEEDAIIHLLHRTHLHLDQGTVLSPILFILYTSDF